VCTAVVVVDAVVDAVAVVSDIAVGCISTAETQLTVAAVVLAVAIVVAALLYFYCRNKTN
jgi:hypothetical protein